MGLDFERGCESAAEIDYSGVFAWSLEDKVTGCWQSPQVDS